MEWTDIRLTVAKSDAANSDTECNACANTAADRTTDTETDGSTGRGRERRRNIY